MAAETGESKDLLAWYAGLRPLTVDIVGDFAGRELFVVHGESLIRHCLEQPPVDFNGGFQILHAVYAVEKLLSNMQKRGCNFDIIFFKDARQLCVAEGHVTSENAYRYLLARDIIVRHLSRSAPQLLDGSRPQILEFDSLEDDGMQVYLEKHSVQFLLCHEGDEGRGPDTVALRSLIHSVISKGINVAIINHIKFQSSKMFLPLVPKTYRDVASTVITTNLKSHLPALTAPALRVEDFDRDIDVSALNPKATIREIYSVVICRAMQRSQQPLGAASHKMTRAFLLHTSFMQCCPLSERRVPSVTDGLEREVLEEALVFIRHLSGAASLLLSTRMFDERVNTGLEAENPTWDLYDFLDGRLFFFVLKRIETGEPFPKSLVDRAADLMSLVVGNAKGALDLKDIPTMGPQSVRTTQDATAKIPSVQPFSHPVIDIYIQGMALEEAEEQASSAADVVFHDLTHWHNSRNRITTKNMPHKKGFFARKRHQKLMADIEVYSRSLTSVGGGNLTRETIIATTPSNTQKGSLARASSSPRRLTGVTKGRDEVRSKKSGQKKEGEKKPRGKEAAFLAAKQMQDAKGDKARDNVARHWASTVATWESNMSLLPLDRYTTAEAFSLSRLSKANRMSLGGEVELYLCHLLGIIWRQQRVGSDHQPRNGMHLLAGTWKWLLSISSGATTPAVQQAVKKLSLALGAPSIPLTISCHVRQQALAFRFSHESFEGAKELITDHKALQLEYGGPYMDRRFDSQPDSRVPFEPDAWQRDVLDSIDSEDTSLLVTAPTSAGKTFISFYAMKKVLQESDDAVLVYVAPTKALVNQIAAEINAHYSKSYPGKAGKSVYGIHTRDYRVNNPTGCQILVTVPHILQILLLSPANALGPNAWSRRVRRIIFDEVHCIGQSEDGVIWEQLLLLAPCPVIALSATIGNPAEFRDWLAASQARKGFRLNMVVHDVRYSELRKFIYTNPAGGRIRVGMERQKTVSVPGLDEGEQQQGSSGEPTGSIQFLHPVVTLSDRNKDALADVSFEARDLFTLWNMMTDLLSKDDMKALDIPDPYSGLLPPIIAKSDVIAWERKMKDALAELIRTRPSVFDQLRSRLEPPEAEKAEERGLKSHIYTLPALAHDLNRRNALPALVFNYDRSECEECAEVALQQLSQAEGEWKASSPEWERKMRNYSDWIKVQAGKPAVVRKEMPARDKTSGSKERLTELDVLQEANVAHSRWEGFRPDAPLEAYSFADHTKLQGSEFDEIVQKMLDEERIELKPWMGPCLRRGIGVHHAGLNRRYRQTVEMLFRRGFLRLVIATGTLAMGINMPCKTVVFSGDSVFLTAQNYRQSSGRAGRRGFDLLGNVVFSGIARQRVYELIASRLPALRGQFPISTTLILRLLALLHGTRDSDFARQAVDALLSQTRLYLGGPEAEDTVRHHLRFSIEYLRRHHLLSATGEPINFAGVVSHLYFTENAVFAFHSLLKGGYFHRLCARIHKDPDGTRLEMVLVLSHLFSRLPVKRTEEFEQAVYRSASVVFLPRLPSEAEALLAAHNRETLSIFKDYVHSYISHSLHDKPDCTLPFTRTAVGGLDATSVWPDAKAPTQAVVRSPFVSLSGFDDDFASIHDLCSTVRDGVFLEESAIPYIPIWGVDAAAPELNAYIYDFYKHGSMDVLTRDNRIRGGDVWFLLKDFSLTLSTIVAGLEGLVGGGGAAGDEDVMEDVAEDPTEARSFAVAEAVEHEQHAPPSSSPSPFGLETRDAYHNSRKKAHKAELTVRDSWDDDDSDDYRDDEDEDGNGERKREHGGEQVGMTDGEPRLRTASSRCLHGISRDEASQPGLRQEGHNLMTVLEAMVSLRDDFHDKFRKVWA